MRKVLAGIACAGLLLGAVACESSDDDCGSRYYPKDTKSTKATPYKAPKAPQSKPRRK